MIPFVKDPSPNFSTMDTSAEPKPSLRADARRNHEKIIAGAREVFARCGASAQMEDVARASGVGVGTVYRHFATKEALMTELVRRKFELFTTAARDALTDGGEPFEVLAQLMRDNAELIAADAAVQQAIMGAGEEVWAGTERERQELGALIDRLARRAKEAGTMRTDVGAQDIPMLMCGICSTMGHKAPGFDWRRHLDLSLDSLRAR